MGLLSLFKTPRDAASAPSADDVAKARARARQRLIGAVILLGIGIVAFPLVFETQPRPIPVDLPIEIPRKESAAPLAVPPPRQASSGVITEKAADAGKDVSSPVAPAVEEPPAKPAAAPKEPPPKPVAKADDAKPPHAVANGRFVVQVGAFSDAALARETRQKVEKLGLKTHTQVVETDAGKRIRVRVGPFASREDADKASAKIKSAGLPSATLGL